MRINRIIPTLLAFVISSCVLRAQPARSMEAFAAAADAYIEKTLELLPAIPGISITVVRTGSPSYVRGFGWADAESGTRMLPDSRIYIASNTKPFVALATAILDHRDVLDLEASVVRYLPCAAFRPDVRAGESTLRHLLTHTSGMSNDPVVFRTAFSGEHTPLDLRRMLASTVVNADAPLGSFSYTNTGYNILGMVMEEATGSAWQDLLREIIFHPLRMSSTTARRSEVGAAVVAAPYRAVSRARRLRLPLEKTDATLHAAGGILSTAEDLSRWLGAQLEPDRYPFPEGVIGQTQTLRAQSEGSVGPFHRDGYGLGWIVGSYSGERMIYHLGTFPGANSIISFMPERGLGVSVFVNEDVVGIRTAILLTSFVYDWWLDAGDAADAKLDSFRADIASRLDSIDPLPSPVRLSVEQSASLGGTYRSHQYGTLVVTVDDGRLKFTIGQLQGVATSFENGLARVPLRPGRPEDFQFVMRDGAVQRVDYGTWGSFHPAGPGQNKRKEED